MRIVARPAIYVGLLADGMYALFKLLGDACKVDRRSVVGIGVTIRADQDGFEFQVGFMRQAAVLRRMTVGAGKRLMVIMIKCQRIDDQVLKHFMFDDLARILVGIGIPAFTVALETEVVGWVAFVYRD